MKYPKPSNSGKILKLKSLRKLSKLLLLSKICRRKRRSKVVAVVVPTVDCTESKLMNSLQGK